MMREIEWLLVDGYNLLYQLHKSFDEMENREDIREKLIQKLLEYSGYHSIKTIVVFDGQGVRIDQDIRSEFLQTVYTMTNETADQWIEKKSVDLIKEGWLVKVVTSDYVEQQVVFGSGALRIPVREMIFEMKQLKKEIKQATESQDKILRRGEIAKRLGIDIVEKLEEIRFSKLKE